MADCKTKSILSLDGGGVRGLVSAVMLETLETKLRDLEPDRDLRDYFDLIAGTSTGSIIACGLAKGLNATSIKQFYRDQALTIFPRFERVLFSFLRRISGGSISRPLYDGQGLDRVLQHPEAFGGLRFGDLPTPLLITSYDTFNRQTVIFLNTQSAFQQIPVWEICRASSAVPIAFPAHLLREPTFISFWQSQGYRIPTDEGQGTIPLVDGGVVANNPTMLALTQRLGWADQPESNQLLLVSLGTGQNIQSIEPKSARDWGPLEWINPGAGLPIIDVLFDGSSDASDYVAKTLLPSESLFRFQPVLQGDFAGFNANPQKLIQLEQLTQQYLAQSTIQTQFDILAHQLVTRLRACQSVP
jgi:patatin-like phospholipase/acyl hydrolase